jgi:hypothetical protein
MANQKTKDIHYILASKTEGQHDLVKSGAGRWGILHQKFSHRLWFESGHTELTVHEAPSVFSKVTHHATNQYKT